MMARLQLILCVACVAIVSGCAQRAPKPLTAFPGAEGFGAYTPGGRGGKVYVVTTLEDYQPSGPSKQKPIPGSFRRAVTAKEPRLVVFAVAGTIHLKDAVHIRNPYLTIAGQSAPGGGVCIAGWHVAVRTHDVVIRHLRFRRGDEAEKTGDSLDLMDASNCIVDHCSASWATDENLSVTGLGTDVTVGWCLISEGLNPRNHGYGSLIAPEIPSRISFHHNLYAHNAGRVPRAGSRLGVSEFLLDFRNNVVFNWGQRGDWGGWGVCGKVGEYLQLNFVGNTHIAGPDTTKPEARTTAMSSNLDSSQAYQADNRIDSDRDGVLDGVDTGWGMFRGQWTRMSKAFAVPRMYRVGTQRAQQAYESVLAGAGATPWNRDSVDARVVASVVSQGGRIINSQGEVGGWPELAGAPAPADADADGMSDQWELFRGLDPGDAADSATDRDGDGYTNVEEYLNELAAR